MVEIVNALEKIFERGEYADKVIEKTLKSHPKWGSRDRKFFAENVYEIVRWVRLLDELSPRKTYWELWGVQQALSERELPDWEELNELNPEKIIRGKSKISKRAIIQSIPDWLDELGEKNFSNKWGEMLHNLNQPSKVYLRANRLKTTVDELIKELVAEEILVKKVRSDIPDALVLAERKNVFATKSFRSGLFEVQDAGSQMIAPLLEPQPGDRVIDACAGAGGKSLHLAALMKNKGKIISLDIHEWKLKELKLRAKRNGVDIIETRVIENQKTIKRLYDSADKVLLDVPCSGLGVLKRNPDTKWKLSIEEIDRLRETQAEILKNYSQMVKKNGRLVYATCSILPEENELQIKNFLEMFPNEWDFIRELHVSPLTDGFDGFYAALLQKK